MAEMKHTPGPWHIVPYGDGDSPVICSDQYGEWRICFMATPGDMFSIGRMEEIKANAHLIAAAPDYAAEVGFLLARLSELDWCGDMDAFAVHWEAHVSPSVERLAMIHASATGAA